MSEMMPPENTSSSAEDAAQAMDAWEMRVQQEAREFTYPPTPDLAKDVRQALRQSPRRLPPIARLAAAIVLMILLALAGVPELRAAVLEMLRVGAVRIFFVEPTAAVIDTPTATVLPTISTTPDAAILSNLTPARTPRPTFTPSATPLQSILDLPGETTLEDAKAQVDFDIVLPTYPSGIGAPDRVFLQHQGDDSIVALVWMKPPELVTPAGGVDSDVWFSLWILDPDAFAGKFVSSDEISTSVNGVRAVWFTDVERLYTLGNSIGDPQLERFVTGSVLLWDVGTVTYRVETQLPLEEARKIAESLE